MAGDSDEGTGRPAGGVAAAAAAAPVPDGRTPGRCGGWVAVRVLRPHPTSDYQDRASSRAWQYESAADLLAGPGVIVAEYFDVGCSRRLPWTQRPQAAALLAAITKPNRSFDAIVVGEYERAFAGDQLVHTSAATGPARNSGVAALIADVDAVTFNATSAIPAYVASSRSLARQWVSRKAQGSLVLPDDERHRQPSRKAICGCSPGPTMK